MARAAASPLTPAPITATSMRSTSSRLRRHPITMVRSTDFRLRINDDVMTTPASALIDRIQARQANIGVIGLGYVGLPLAVEFAKAGFHVTGFDVDSCKSDQINAGVSYIPDVS